MMLNSPDFFLKSRSILVKSGYHLKGRLFFILGSKFYVQLLTTASVPKGQPGCKTHCIFQPGA
jgi:hypothetical protein